MYKVLNYIIREGNNWEGVIVEKEDGKRYYTNGVYFWEETEKRKNDVTIVNSINMDEFNGRLKEFYPYTKLDFSNIDSMSI